MFLASFLGCLFAFALVAVMVYSIAPIVFRRMLNVPLVKRAAEEGAKAGEKVLKQAMKEAESLGEIQEAVITMVPRRGVYRIDVVGPLNPSSAIDGKLYLDANGAASDTPLVNASITGPSMPEYVE